jgi:NAD+ synthase (glutamine-hydrolysing)
MRLALVQLNPTVGDIPDNAKRITDWIDRARNERADIVVFPELALSGYPPKDLLLVEGFVAACTRTAKQIGEEATEGITAVFGVPLPLDPDRTDGPVANALLAYRDGRMLAYYDKRLLPTYDVFDEDRYFEPGDRAAVIETAGRNIGLAICEDLWKGEDAGFASRYLNAPDPAEELAHAGAEVFVVPSASPFVLGKGARHRRILRRQAVNRRVFVASVNQVGGNDDLVFDGHAAVYDPRGRLIAAGPGFREEIVLADLREDAPEVDDPLLAAPGEQLLFGAITLGARDYLRKTGHSRGIVGLSGGIDSAVTAALAVAALGPDNVLGVSMPGRYSSEHSHTDAHDLAERLGIACLTIPIDRPFEGFRQAMDPAFISQGMPTLGSIMPDVTEQNIQSRARGTILMALSNRTGAIVLTTGNKSELAVGYCTLYGDMNGGLAVLADVGKQQVYAIARWINAHHAACGFARPPIPEGSITKPPSAELAPNQLDQDTLPPYDLLDTIIERYVERRQAADTIIRQTGIDPAVVARVARMIDAAEYKRKQLATGLKVTTVAFGSGRRFPIAHRWRG